VPAAGGGVLGPRKPLYRCIPEIHVTRLSVSSSLRPKFGLLLLTLVLIVSLCLLGVPLVTKVLVPLVHDSYNQASTTSSKSTLPFSIQLLTEVINLSTDSNLVVSPWLVESSLATLARWSQGLTKEQLLAATANCANCTAVEPTIANREGLLELSKVFFVPSQQVKEDVITRDQGVVAKFDTHRKEAQDQLRQWLRQNTQILSTDWITQHTDNSKIVGLNSAALNITIQGNSVVDQFQTETGQSVAVKMLEVEGNFLTTSLADTTVIVMDGLGEALSLCLLFPHTVNVNMSPDASEQCQSSLLRRERLQVTVPSLEISSRLSLASHLKTLALERMFSEEAEFALVSPQKGLRLEDIFQVASIKMQNKVRNRQDKKQDHHPQINSIVINRPFTFLVQQKTSNRTVFAGRFSQPDIVSETVRKS